jgi:hypothetical protein
MPMTDQAPIEYIEAPDGVQPVCPHCRQELHKVWTITRGLAFIGQDRVLLCPHCRAVLAYGQWASR